MADEPAGAWLEIVLEAFRDHEQEPRELGVGHRWMTIDGSTCSIRTTPSKAIIAPSAAAMGPLASAFDVRLEPLLPGQ